jgi:hypothetical protein
MLVGFSSTWRIGISKIAISKTRVEVWTTPIKIEDSWTIESGWWWGSFVSSRTKWTIKTISSS